MHVLAIQPVKIMLFEDATNSLSLNAYYKNTPHNMEAFHNPDLVTSLTLFNVKF